LLDFWFRHGKGRVLSWEYDHTLMVLFTQNYSRVNAHQGSTRLTLPFPCPPCDQYGVAISNKNNDRRFRNTTPETKYSAGCTKTLPSNRFGGKIQKWCWTAWLRGIAPMGRSLRTEWIRKWKREALRESPFHVYSLRLSVDELLLFKSAYRWCWYWSGTLVNRSLASFLMEEQVDRDFIFFSEERMDFSNWPIITPSKKALDPARMLFGNN